MNKSNDKDSDFLVMFPPARLEELLREEKGWLIDVSHNLWWHMKCAPHAALDPNSKRWDFLGIFGGGTWID